jgi:uncharacterized protein YcbK (DUF882 family)
VFIKQKNFMFCNTAVDSSRRRFVACSTGVAAAMLPKALMFSENILKDELVGLDFIEAMPTIANELVVPEIAEYTEPPTGVFEPEILSEGIFEPEILTDGKPVSKPRQIANKTKSRIKAKIAQRAKSKQEAIAKNQKSYRRRRVLASNGERKIQLRNLHTGERLRATYWEDGKYIPETMRDVAHFLRDHRTGDKHRIDAGLMDILHDLHLRTGNRREFHIISGYRSPKTNRMLSSRSGGVAKRSLHMRGRAIDIRLPGTDLHKLRKAALSMRAGGVGYYPQANFLHVDTGRYRTWG